MMKVTLLLVLTTAILSNTWKVEVGNNEWDMFLDEQNNNELAFLETQEGLAFIEEFADFIEMKDEQPIIYRSWLKMSMGILTGLGIDAEESQIEVCPMLNKNFFQNVEDIIQTVKNTSGFSWIVAAPELAKKVEGLTQMDIIQKKCVDEIPSPLNEKILEVAKKIKETRKRDIVGTVLKEFSELTQLLKDALKSFTDDEDSFTLGLKFGQFLKIVFKL